MTDPLASLLRRSGATCRGAVAALLSGMLPGRTIDDVEDRLSARPLPEQAAIVGGVLAALFLLSLLFAQAGWIGILLFWLGIILIAR